MNVERVPKTAELELPYCKNIVYTNVTECATKLHTGYKKLLKPNIGLPPTCQSLPGKAHVTEQDCINIRLCFERFFRVARAVARVGIDPDQ
jgi:hypothetical protein